MSDLLDRIALAESGGNINARSPTPLSSAQGLFGFTDAAFNQVKQDHPDLANVSKEQWAVDPQLQRTFADRLKQRHERVLRGQGLDVNPVNMYANWHFGEGGGPKFLRSAPDTPMESILDPVAIAANPHLQGKTQAQVMQLLSQKVGAALPNAVAQTQGNMTMNPNQPQGSALPNATAAYGNRAVDPMQLYQQLLAQQTNAAPQQLTPEQQQMLMGDRQQRASVLPLAIGASLAGDKRISALGGQLYQDATNAQGPMKMGNDGWMTADGQLIENPFTNATREESRNDRLLQLALSAAGRGKTPDPYFQPIQTANGVFAFNSRSGQMELIQGPSGQPIVGSTSDPKLQGEIAGAKKNATVTADATATEIVNAPKVITSGEYTKKLIDDLLAHPGMSQAVGKSRMFGIQNIPGTDAKDFDIRLGQLQGKQFLEAFESLKGGGAITQVEGEKATQAIARMNAAGTEKGFIEAAKEFQGIVQQGLEKARRAAERGGAPATSAQAPNTQSGGGLSAEEQRELDELRSQFGRR
ncbi:hypothetical protein UFOVP381_2 [uncultured Caudovirales phage]|uniref:Uncharacterized protein n=1 Tax=uncultured Caudovirales phage TaxID=2100421 RepID=A0A6J7WYJ9_9CAUD|nr:hypothetical protein UFOVP381_2 [uncultured Caudovirales phage]